MKFKILIITIITSLLIQSCDDKLDILPEDGITAPTLYQSEAGAIAGIMGIYSRIHFAYRQSIINNIYPVSGTDEGFQNRSKNQNFQENNFTSSETQLLESWSRLYEGINAANIAVIELERTTGLSDEARAVLTAEARFARGYILFDLQRAFGGTLGIPMPTDLTTKTLLPRTPGVDVYTQIIADLEYAAENLLDIQETVPGRASKSAAQGMLARVCLTRAGAPFTNDGDYYSKAKFWAKKVIDGGYHKLNGSYEDVFKKLAEQQHETEEVLFQIGFYFATTNQEAGKVGNELGMRIDPQPCYDRGYSQISPAITLTQAYRADPSDERGLWNTSPYYIKTVAGTCDFVTQPNQLQYGCTKYRKSLQLSGAGSWGSHHWPVLRYSDVLLMYAEAENQITPGSANALNAVNEVRNRAKATALTTISEQLIQEERRLELCWEGLRKFDLVRWGLLQEKVDAEILAMDAAHGNENPDWPIFGTGGTKNNTVQAYYKDVYNNYVDNKHQILPLPEVEMGANELITVQNPNW